MKTPIYSSSRGSWQAEARRMRAQGKAADEIAALIGQTAAAVREALRGTRRTPLAVLGAGRAKLPEPHIPRTPRAPLDRTVCRRRRSPSRPARLTAPN